MERIRDLHVVMIVRYINVHLIIIIIKYKKSFVVVFPTWPVHLYSSLSKGRGYRSRFVYNMLFFLFYCFTLGNCTINTSLDGRKAFIIDHPPYVQINFPVSLSLSSPLSVCLSLVCPAIRISLVRAGRACRRLLGLLQVVPKYTTTRRPLTASLSD